MSSLETSDSQSSNFSKPKFIKADVSSIIKIDFPVPCKLCKVKFDSREDQIHHYHSDTHIAKLIITVQNHTKDIFSTNYNLKPQYDDTQKVYFETEDSFSQKGSQLSYFCADCNVEHNSEKAYTQHLKTKRHFNNCKSQDLIISNTNPPVEFEDIE